MGFCYQELGDFRKAYDIWCEIADELKTAGYEIEAKYEMELAQKCKEILVKDSDFDTNEGVHPQICG